MLTFISVIVSIAYFIWLSKLISFGVQTATRIAIATETSAATLAILVQALPAETKERIAAAAKAAALAEQARAMAAAGTGKTGGDYWPLVGLVGAIAFMALMVFVAMHSAP